MRAIFPLGSVLTIVLLLPSAVGGTSREAREVYVTAEGLAAACIDAIRLPGGSQLPTDKLSVNKACFDLNGSETEVTIRIDDLSASVVEAWLWVYDAGGKGIDSLVFCNQLLYTIPERAVEFEVYLKNPFNGLDPDDPLLPDPTGNLADFIGSGPCREPLGEPTTAGEVVASFV